MSRPSQREKILEEGLRVVHERGYAAASVRDIVAAAGVPLGSFTNYFPSKESFGVEILEIYRERRNALMRETLLNEDLPPLKRLRAYLDALDPTADEKRMRRGCLIGNFSIEASEHSDAIRERVVEVLGESQRAFKQCLAAAVKAGELPPKTDIEALSGFIVDSLQGVILRSKAERSSAPMKRFKKTLFSTVLR